MSVGGKAARRRRVLTDLRGDARAPIEWTWDGFMEEEARRTVARALLGGALLVEPSLSPVDRRLGKKLAHHYWSLWGYREKYIDTPRPADLARLSAASARLPQFSAYAAAWPGRSWIADEAVRVRVRLAMFADFCLRSPRQMRPLPGRLDEPTWADEHRVGGALGLEAEWLARLAKAEDPSRRAPARTRV